MGKSWVEWMSWGREGYMFMCYLSIVELCSCLLYVLGVLLFEVGVCLYLKSEYQCWHFSIVFLCCITIDME